MAALEFDRVAVLVPCFNEGGTIASVVRDFLIALPGARVHVFDNESTDDTIQRARAAGALVRRVRLRGKGNVIRRMFADVEADEYLLVDGDDTYDSNSAPAMVRQLRDEGLDMVVGTRAAAPESAYRVGHRFGNTLLTGCVGALFGRSFTDMLSGYRVFSRRYVKSFPASAAGFETETELTVHALELRMPVAEVKTVYRARPEGSFSKLNTYADGLRILRTILNLFKSERPLAFFSMGFGTCVLLALVLAIPIFGTFLKTGLVPRLPTALLCTALVLVGAILLICGIVLDAVTRGRTESKRFAYLAVPGPALEAPSRVKTSRALGRLLYAVATRWPGSGTSFE